MAPQHSDSAIDPSKPGSGPMLGDPIVERTMSEDPLAKYLQKHWKQLLVAIAVALAAAWFVHMFRETYRERMRESADTFARIQNEYSQLRSLERELLTPPKPKDGQKPEDVLKELQTKIDASRDRLAQGLPALVDSEPPYSQIGRIYQDLLERSRANVSVLKADLAALNWAGDKPGSQQRFYDELRALVIARALLDEPSTKVEARKTLKDLAANGETAYVPAALAVARLAETPEEMTAAARILEALLKRSPTQRETVKPELDRLNAALGVE